MSARCVICGVSASSRHHPTGRGGSGEYLDPDFHLPACDGDQNLANEDWNTLGVARTRADASAFEDLALALRRLGVFFGRLAERDSRIDLFCALARWCQRWADALDRDVARLDLDAPGWRIAARSGE